jgi:hypothetical protein
MGEIELPSYRIIVSNEVFGKKAEPLNHPLMGDVPATQIARLTRFRIPTKEEVIDFIRTSAKGIDAYSLGKDKPSDSDPKTVYFLKSLPASEVKDISRGNQDSLKHLGNHYPESNLQEGRIYLGSFNGIVPNLVLDSARELMKQEGTEVYDRAIERTGSKEWNLRIRLLANGAFPDKLELEYLLDRGVRDSDVFSAQGDFGDYQTVVNQIRVFYNVLQSPEIIAQIGDTSYHFLEQRAASTVRETAECIAARNSIGGLAGMLGQFFGDLKNQADQPKPKKPSGDCGFSLN